MVAALPADVVGELRMVRYRRASVMEMFLPPAHGASASTGALLDDATIEAARLVMEGMPSLADAAALETLTFFFGKGVASRAAELLRGAPPDEPCTVPECTGVWTRRKRPRVRVRIRAAGPHGVVCEIV